MINVNSSSKQFYWFELYELKFFFVFLDYSSRLIVIGLTSY